MFLWRTRHGIAIHSLFSHIRITFGAWCPYGWGFASRPGPFDEALSMLCGLRGFAWYGEDPPLVLVIEGIRKSSGEGRIDPVLP